MNDSFEAINKRKHTVAAFIDLNKAFDRVNHNILREKLFLASIKGNTLKLLSDYLNNRFQNTLSNVRKCQILEKSLVEYLRVQS